MKPSDLLSAAKDTITVKRVFGDPYEKDGVTVIPAAAVVGGAGGGEGTDPQGQQGEGGGFGTSARPVGVYLLKDGNVTWRPAVDVNRTITVLGLIIVVLLLRRPRKRRRTTAG